MSDGPIGEPPNTSSMESLHPLKLIEYPPNAFLVPFAMFPPLVSGSLPGFSNTQGITTTRTRGEKQKTPPVGALRRRENTPSGYRDQPPKAGITSRANQRSCSLNSFGGIPSAQWIMKWSRPGYFFSIDLMPSMTCDGGPTNHAFCWIP